MRKIISLLVVVLFVSCTSQRVIAPIDFKGNYRFIDSKQTIKIEILDSNKITIEKKVEANIVKCLGDYKIISDKKIKIKCTDERSERKATSITDFVPLRFDIKNESIYLESNIIKYKNQILRKE